MCSLQQPRSLLTTAIPLSPSPPSRGFHALCPSPSLSLRAPLRDLDRNIFLGRSILRAACMRSSASDLSTPGFGAQQRGWQVRASNPGNGESSRTEEERSSEASASSFRWRKQSDTLEDYPQRKSRTDGDGVYSKSFPGEPKGRPANQSLNGSRRSTYRDKEHVKSRSFNGQAQNGTSERRHKHPKIKEQIKITSPLRQSPHVAILGGGMSGLICALTLQEKGIRSTVFDTGKHGLGGRMGTRHIAHIDGSSLVFDHAAQYFTATDSRFQELVNQWMSEGAVKEWDGIVGTLEKGGAFSQLHGGKKYIATKGMRLLADHILSKRKLIDVKRPCWISKMMEIDGLWHLSENGQDQGTFDMVVIAHNGKCANRLLAPVGVPHVAKQMKRLELSSIWALMAAFKDPFPLVESATGKVQIDGAFVTGVNSLSWMGNNTSKLELSDNNGPYCWTFFSTAIYGKKNKVPQESIPTARAIRVKREMLEGVESALGLPQGSLPTPIYMRVQLWGAALPLNTPNEPCIFDAYGRVGICGDWLIGSNLEAAALSGMAMANQISSFCNARGLNPEGFCIGLTKELVDVKGHDIGQFSHQENRHETPRTEVLTAV